MASPDTIVDYHAAIGGKTHVPLCVRLWQTTDG